MRKKNPSEGYNTLDYRSLFEAPVQDPKNPDAGFYAKGGGIFYKMHYGLAATAPLSDAPEKLLLRTSDITGPMGQLLADSDVADLVAQLLNECRTTFFADSKVSKRA